ncbi:MAG: hypothetical protein WB511_14010 [Nitrososphaeraceae archaeon]
MTGYASSELIDNYGRIAKKLRISVTDRCNMRCIYCMPPNNKEWLDDTDVLSFDEIVRLTTIFVTYFSLLNSVSYRSFSILKNLKAIF